MKNIEKAEMHRDMVEMELVETEHFLQIMISSDMATLHEVEDIENAIRELRRELDRAGDEVKIARLECAFVNLSDKELRGLITSKNTDWKVKEASQRIKDQRQERKIEREVA